VLLYGEWVEANVLAPVAHRQYVFTIPSCCGPMSLAKMSDDDATGSAIYRSKMHLGPNRNFQVMPGAQWLELLCRHIPNRDAAPRSLCRLVLQSRTR